MRCFEGKMAGVSESGIPAVLRRLNTQRHPFSINFAAFVPGGMLFLSQPSSRAERCDEEKRIDSSGGRGWADAGRHHPF